MKILDATNDSVKKAAAIIRNGGVVVYPTETVYGLGCAPQIPEAAQRICQIKGRADKPLPLVCSDVKTAKRIVEFNPAAERLADKFWPGPLMLVLPAKVEYSIWVTHGAKTLGLRVPSHKVSKELARLSGGIIVSTSANRSGEEPHTTAQGAVEQFGKEVDMVLSGGKSPGGTPSTVLDLSGEQAWILRKGPITAEQIKNALSV